MKNNYYPKTFGRKRGRKRNFSILDYKINLESSYAKIKYNDNIHEIETNLIGRFNLYNLASAILCCLKIGIHIV